MSDVLDSEDRTRSRLRRPLVIVGAAALVVTAGVGVAAAASNTPNASPLAAPAADATATATATATPEPKNPDPGERRKPRGWPGKHRLGGPFGALHGEFTVPKEGGGFQTIATQRGEATAVSASSITVKSEDGYSRTYAVTATTMVRAERDGIGAIKVGDQVAVTAAVSGEKATATNVVDLTQVRKAAKDRDWPKIGPR